ncbi:hypothetical protein MMC07_009472 [Pseudocyphellaria aurata]|nr:hypothetical protein [Pseudocyphellaria aurata]
MFLGGLVGTNTRAVRLSQLQVWKPHPYSSPSLRVQVPQTVRDNRRIRCLRIRFNDTSVESLEHVQTKDGFTDTPVNPAELAQTAFSKTPVKSAKYEQTEHNSSDTSVESAEHVQTEHNSTDTAVKSAEHGQTQDNFTDTEHGRLHERTLEKSKVKYHRELKYALEEKERSENLLHERLALADEKTRHPEEKATHLAGKDEIAKAAAQQLAAQSKNARTSSSASPTVTLGRGPAIPPVTSAEHVQAEHAQPQDIFTEIFTATQSFQPETHSVRSNSNAITSHQRDQIPKALSEHLVKLSSNAITSNQRNKIYKALSVRSSELSQAKALPLTGDSILDVEHSSQQWYSETRKEKRRESLAERANQHKRNKDRLNELLKDRGHSSQDWETPLRLLSKRTSQRYTDTPPLIRRHRPCPSFRQLHANKIPKPEEWSSHTFWCYVQELTQSSVDRLSSRQIYGKKDSHAAQVSRILKQAFLAPATREILSPEAINVALDWFYKRSDIPQAVAFFDYMQWLRMAIPSKTMDIMLQSCARQKDLYNFTKILRECTKRGIAPSPSTWTAFIQTVRSRQVQEYIIEMMRERNMLEDFRTVREVVKFTVREDIIKHLDDGLDPTSFLDSMDTRFGRGWLSGSAGNNILYEVGQRRPAAEVVSMLDVLMERGMDPDVATLNTLLLFCSRERDHLLAIRVLRLLHVEKGIRTDGRTFDYLFMQAWRSRLYNFARVIWRTACIEGVASHKVQILVQSNLVGHGPQTPPAEPGSRAHIWRESAGKVIVGVKPANDLDHMLSSNPVTGPNAAREQLIADDMGAAGRYRLVDDLAELLTEALKLDREWMESGAWKGESAEWKRKMGIAVRVREVGGIPVLSPTLKEFDG